MPSQGNVEVDTTARPLKVLQITDMHLFENVDKGLGGIVTDKSFASVWEQVKARHWDADLIVSTGDIAQESCRAVYKSAAARLREMVCPVLALPGNHDHAEVMFADSLWDNTTTPAIHHLGKWSIILLNSAIPGCVHGRIDVQQLTWLCEQLAAVEQDQRFALVCLHHHPVQMGSQWIDRLGLENAEEYWRTIESFSSVVRGVMWGHVHQQYDQWRGNVRLMATPSTGFQFSSGRDDFKLDEVNPGYRCVTLHPDGRIDTHIERLEGDDFKPDVDFGGY